MKVGMKFGAMATCARPIALLLLLASCTVTSDSPAPGATSQPSTGQEDRTAAEDHARDRKDPFGLWAGFGARPPFDRIELERTECFGTCPAYTVTLWRDGQATYSGRAHAP